MLIDETIHDIWSVTDADAIIIPTNGVMRKTTGWGVCGAGLALEAKKRCPAFERRLGKLLAIYGNRPFYMGECNNVMLVSFPTKNHWREKSDIALIKQSCADLNVLAHVYKWTKVVLPRVGCGCGGLDWETDVFPVVSGLLDDRFVVVSGPTT